MKRTIAFILSVLLLAGLCSCGMKQYGIQRPPGSSVEDSYVPPVKGGKIGFYTDQTESMYGFCGQLGYVTTLNEVRSLLKSESVKDGMMRQIDIYRYDSIVHQIKENVFIQHYSDGVLNVKEYYNTPKKDGGPSKGLRENAFAASAKGNVKPLEFALRDAYKKDKYTDSLCVITTECYEQNRDYAVLFKPLSEKVLKRGNAVGFMGIKSDYKGTVKCVSADNGKDYKHDGKRMFYLIVAGPTDDVTSFCSALSERLSEKNIENYYSTFIPGGKTVSFLENSITLEPEDMEADELSETADGKSFAMDDMSEFLIKEDGLDYYPTFSVRLPKSSKSRSTFTVTVKESMEGVEAYPLEVQPIVMSYNGALEEKAGKDADKDSGKDKQPEKSPDMSGNASSDQLKITQQPKDVVFTLGESVTVSIKAQGKDLTYQWYYKKAEQKSFTLWNSHTHDTETVTPNESWDNIQLYCSVKDSSGKTVKSKVMKVTLFDETEEEETTAENTATTASAETTTSAPEETLPTQPLPEKPDEFVLSGVAVKEAPFKVKESIAVNWKDTVLKDGKLRICTDFKDASLIKDSGPILVKYIVRIGKLEETPAWILENSASGTSTEEERSKTLDLTYVYDGLRQACNATLDNSELLTFYCYYS